MHQFAIYSLIVVWLAPGSLWRPVAMALLVTWGLCEAVYAVTGLHAPRDLYFACDAIVMLVVATRRSHWSDLAIIPLIVAQWRWYPEGETRYGWEWLYWLTVIQFLIAGPWPQVQRSLKDYTHGPMRPVKGLNRGV